ncbi:hypothetical protein Btru_027048 [Bulinus truncatus]|nr:hypothetical protein Btru_027048 [Bulinus truncatus]
MDPLIARCCKTFTYLDVNDSLFKDRLIFSLSTKDRSARRRDRIMSKKKSAQKPPRRPEPVSPSQIESVVYDNLAYCPPVTRPPEPVRSLSNKSLSLSQNGSKDKSSLNSSQRLETPSSPSSMESGIYDSITYFHTVNHPPEPLRVMSNMSTTSTTSLIQ